MALRVAIDSANRISDRLGAIEDDPSSRLNTLAAASKCIAEALTRAAVDLCDVPRDVLKAHVTHLTYNLNGCAHLVDALMTRSGAHPPSDAATNVLLRAMLYQKLGGVRQSLTELADLPDNSSGTELRDASEQFWSAISGEEMGSCVATLEALRGQLLPNGAESHLEGCPCCNERTRGAHTLLQQLLPEERLMEDEARASVVTKLLDLLEARPGSGSAASVQANADDVHCLDSMDRALLQGVVHMLLVMGGVQRPKRAAAAEQASSLQKRRQPLPKSFLCPINQTIMRDPVTVTATGHTYERAAIETWFRDHNTDPSTNKRLRYKKLVPAFAFKGAIEECLEMAGMTHDDYDKLGDHKSNDDDGSAAPAAAPLAGEGRSEGGTSGAVAVATANSSQQPATPVPRTVSSLDRYDRAPLHRAAANGKLDDVKTLLATGANKDVKNEGLEKRTIEEAAAAAAAAEAAAAAAAEAEAARKHEEAAAAEAAAAAAKKQEEAALAAAAERKKAEERAASIALVKDGRVSSSLLEAAMNGHLEVVKALLAAGADKEVKDTRYGETPLHWAAAGGHLEVVKALLAAGADKDVKSIVSHTPLHNAAFRGHLEVVKALLAAGADKEVKKYDGWTPLHEAAFGGRLGVVKALLAAGADKDVKAKDGWTPLHKAARWGRLEVVKALLAAGADKEIKSTEDGWTLLHLAAEGGNLEVVKALLAAGADKEVKTEDGETPLHLAALNGHLEVVKALLAAGADKEVKNKSGQRPVDLAEQWGKRDVAELLHC